MHIANYYEMSLSYHYRYHLSNMLSSRQDTAAVAAVTTTRRRSTRCDGETNLEENFY